MRKKLCFLLASIILLFVGCTHMRIEPSEKTTNSTVPNDQNVTGVPIEEFLEQDLVVPKIQNERQEIALEKLSDKWNCIYIFDKVGTHYWGTKFEKNEHAESENRIENKELLIEYDPYKEIALQYPEKFPQWQVSSGKNVIMQNRYIYEWFGYTADPSTMQDVKLMCKDAVTGKVTVVDERKVETPLVYLLPVDDTHFLSYYSAQNKSSQSECSWFMVAELYDMTGTKKEIVRETYEDDNDWPSSKGRAIEKFAVKDGEIYGLGRQRNAGVYSTHLYHYSQAGKLLDTQELPDMEKVLGDEQTLELHLVGDYIVIRTYETLTTYICKNAETGLECIAKGAYGQLSYAISKYDKNPYIFFIEGNVGNDGTIKDSDCPLFAINTNSHKITSFPLQLPLKSPSFDGLQVLSNGDMLLSYCEGNYNPLDIKKFIVKKDRLEQILR